MVGQTEQAVVWAGLRVWAAMVQGWARWKRWWPLGQVGLTWGFFSAVCLMPPSVARRLMSAGVRLV